MQAEEKRKNKREYLNAFRKKENGSYVYMGELYYWQGEEKELKKKRSLLWLFCAGAFLLATASCCVPAPGSINCFYVLFPCALCFLFGLSVCYAMCRLSAGRNPLRAYVYKATVEKLPLRLLGMGLGAGAAFLGEVIYVCRNGTEEKVFGFLLFVSLEGAVIFATVCAGKLLKGMSWNCRESGISEEI